MKKSSGKNGTYLKNLYKILSFLKIFRPIFGFLFRITAPANHAPQKKPFLAEGLFIRKQCCLSLEAVTEDQRDPESRVVVFVKVGVVENHA
jgi:hypothetical protein